MELTAAGLPGLNRAPYNLTLFTSYYGVESEQRFSDSAINYSRKAVDFLYEKLQNLDKRNFRFAALKKRQDYTKDYDNTIFIGDNYYEIQEIKAVNTQKPEQSASIKRSYTGKGAFCTVTPNDSDHSVKEAYIFIPSSDFALFSAFSEIIPITTIKASRLAYGEGIDSVIADEAISEGISRVLALELAQKLEIPNAEKRIRSIELKSYKPMIYKHVPEAIKWIEKNGVQKAFDIYMENPTRFMDLIKSQ
jgi:hypothetical protein